MEIHPFSIQSSHVQYVLLLLLSLSTLPLCGRLLYLAHRGRISMISKCLMVDLWNWAIFFAFVLAGSVYCLLNFDAPMMKSTVFWCTSFPQLATATKKTTVFSVVFERFWILRRPFQLQRIQQHSFRLSLLLVSVVLLVSVLLQTELYADLLWNDAPTDCRSFGCLLTFSAAAHRLSLMVVLGLADSLIMIVFLVDFRRFKRNSKLPNSALGDRSNSLIIAVIINQVIIEVIPLTITAGFVISGTNVASKIGPHVMTLAAVDGFVSLAVYTWTIKTNRTRTKSLAVVVPLPPAEPQHALAEVKSGSLSPTGDLSLTLSFGCHEASTATFVRAFGHNRCRLLYWRSLGNCNCHGENFCFRGTDQRGRPKMGVPFDCSFHSYLQRHELLDQDVVGRAADYQRLNLDWTPVFVTPCSKNHFNESRGMIKSIRETYKNARIVYYDIGLTEAQAEEVRGWCNVEYRLFNFNAYPPHLTWLKSYAFKIMLIVRLPLSSAYSSVQEALQDWKSFFYVDSSVRIRKPILHRMVDAVKEGRMDAAVLELQRLPPLDLCDHVLECAPSFACLLHLLFGETYHYLPTARLIASAYEEFAATNLFVSDSEYTRRMFKWHALCLLTPGCVGSPSWNEDCRVSALQSHDVYHRYVRCHRFDQAAANLISIAVNLQLGNFNRTGWTVFSAHPRPGDVFHYTREFESLVEVGRNHRINKTLRIECSP
ncbi:hypothetical protein M3Y99_01210000 [Aphelenchoides fujianensis]|nr:hypothetical protein M3Y99_01210000 [Aphelenchoides fujianensis]